MPLFLSLGAFYVRLATNSCFICLFKCLRFLYLYYFIIPESSKYFLVGKMEGVVGILEHLVGKVLNRDTAK